MQMAIPDQKYYHVINFGSLAFDQVAMNPSQVLRGGRDTKRNS